MAEAVILVDDSSGRDKRIGVTTTLGRRSLGRVTDDAHFASSSQFEISRDDEAGAWTIRHILDADNPTFYSGTELSETPQPIEDGAVVSIGADKMKLNIKLAY